MEIPMATLELRAEIRVPITHRGTLGAPSPPFPCLIQEFSTKGFLIMSGAKVQIGDILELNCELYPERFLKCQVEVRHINDDCIGTKIVEISEAGSKLCRQFIDQHYSLNRFG
jgi:PilZ domain